MTKLIEDSNYNVGRIKGLLAKAVNSVKPLISDFNLDKIKLLISYRVDAAGDYQANSNTLRLSANLSAESDEEILNVAYHELAHYLTHQMLGMSYSDTHALDAYTLENSKQEFDKPDLFEKYNLRKYMPGLFSKDIYLFMIKDLKPIDIVDLSTGKVMHKAIEYPTFGAELDALGNYYPAFKKLNSGNILNIPEEEWTSANEDYQHGKLWRLISDMLEQKVNCKIDKTYTHNKMLGTGTNYEVSCPKCGWEEVVNSSNNSKLYKQCVSAEKEGKQFACTKCNTPLKIKNYTTNKVISEALSLTEATRVQLAANSRNAGAYKDQSMGKNRFERKKHSKIAASVKQYNDIDMNQLFKNDRLEVKIPVIGETDTYAVTVRIDGVIAEIARNIKVNKYKLEFRTIIQSLTKVFNTTDVFINCTCPDHNFNFSHWNIMHNCSTLDSAHDPGPGKGIANPHDDKGRGCKHSLLVLANGDWMMKVASVINNYLHYMSEKMQKPFLKLIFPKLYGCEAEEMAKLDILGKEEVEDTLETSASFIDAINEYGKNRGKIKKGENRNKANKAIEEPEDNTIDNQEDPNIKNLKKAEKESDAADKKAADELQDDPELDTPKPVKEPEPVMPEDDDLDDEAEENK